MENQTEKQKAWNEAKKKMVWREFDVSNETYAQFEAIAHARGGSLADEEFTSRLLDEVLRGWVNRARETPGLPAAVI